MAGCDWLEMVGAGWSWLEMVVDGCGWLWMDIAGWSGYGWCGWLGVVRDGGLGMVGDGCTYQHSNRHNSMVVLYNYGLYSKGSICNTICIERTVLDNKTS